MNGLFGLYLQRNSSHALYWLQKLQPNFVLLQDEAIDLGPEIKSLCPSTIRIARSTRICPDNMPLTQGVAVGLQLAFWAYGKADAVMSVNEGTCKTELEAHVRAGFEAAVASVLASHSLDCCIGNFSMGTPEPDIFCEYLQAFWKHYAFYLHNNQKLYLGYHAYTDTVTNSRYHFLRPQALWLPELRRRSIPCPPLVGTEAFIDTGNGGFKSIDWPISAELSRQAMSSKGYCGLLGFVYDTNDSDKWSSFDYSDRSDVLEHMVYLNQHWAPKVQYLYGGEDMPYKTRAPQIYADWLEAAGRNNNESIARENIVDEQFDTYYAAVHLAHPSKEDLTKALNRCKSGSEEAILIARKLDIPLPHDLSGG